MAFIYTNIDSKHLIYLTQLKQPQDHTVDVESPCLSALYLEPLSLSSHPVNLVCNQRPIAVTDFAVPSSATFAIYSIVVTNVALCTVNRGPLAAPAILTEWPVFSGLVALLFCSMLLPAVL